MILRIGLVCVLFTLSCLVIPTSFAQDDTDEVCAGIVLVEGWVRPSVATTTAIYGKFINLGTEDDMLIGITSDLSPTIELHESSMVDDTMEMRPVENGIHLPTQGVVSLETGGLHGMVIGLDDFVEVEQTVTVTFEFMQAGSFDAELVVGDPAELDLDDEEPLPAIVMNDAHCEDTVGFYGAWSRPAIEGGTSAAYGILLNLSEEDDTLTGATNEIAEATEIHINMMMDDGTMMMRPVEGGISVPSGDYVILQPGGLHIMLIDLVNPLAEDDSFDVVLIFENAGERTVSVPVLTNTTSNNDMMSHDH